MAQACGWDKDYIADNLTVQQIDLYCRTIRKQQLRDIKLNTIASFKAIATAIGTMKFDEFKKLLDALEVDSEHRPVSEEDLEELKKRGLFEDK